MKVNVTNLLLTALVLVLAWNSFFKTEPDPVPQPITITLPESQGTTGKVEKEPEPEVIVDTIYLKGDKEIVQVDKGYKELYEKTDDSLKRLNLYLKAIQVRKYNDTLVNNEEITIKGDATVRGSLLNYTVDYYLKERDFTYTPEVVTKLPDLSLGLGFEAGIPTIPESSFVMKGNLSFMNKKGNEINLGYDTEKRVWLGYTKTFKLKK